MDALTNLRIRTGHDKDDLSADEILEELLEESASIVKGYTNRKDMPPECILAQVRIAVSLYNHAGAEGEASHSEGGVSFNIDPISPDVKAMLRPYRLATTGRSD